MLLLGKILTVVLTIFLVMWMIRVIRSNSAMFSSKNLNKSFFTMGMLALILIAFIALIVMWL